MPFLKSYLTIQIDEVLNSTKLQVQKIQQILKEPQTISRFDLNSSTEMTTHVDSIQNGAEPTAHEIAVAEVNAIVDAVKAAVEISTEMAAEKESQMVAKSGSPLSCHVATEGPTPETTPETTPPLRKNAALPNAQTGTGSPKKAEKQRAKRRRQRVKQAKKLARIDAAYSRAPSCEPMKTLETAKEKASKEKAAPKSLERTEVPTQKKKAILKLAKPKIDVQDQAEEMFDFEVNKKDIPFIDDWEKFVDDEDIPSIHHSKSDPAFDEESPISLPPDEKIINSTDLAAAPLKEEEEATSLEQKMQEVTSQERTSSNPIALAVASLTEKDEALSLEQGEVAESEIDAFTILAISLPSTRIDVASISPDLLLAEAHWKDAEEELSANDEVAETEDQAKETFVSLGGRDDGPDRTDGPGGSDGSDGSDESDGSFHESHNSPDPEPPKKKVRFTFAGLSPFSPREPRKLRRRKKGPSMARLMARGIKRIAHKIKNKVRRFARAVWKLGRNEDPEESLEKEPSRLRKWKTILSLLVSK